MLSHNGAMPCGVQILTYVSRKGTIMKEDFIKYCLREYGIKVKFIPCDKDKADTFESIFWHLVH